MASEQYPDHRPIPVFLLKTPSSLATTDPYEQSLLSQPVKRTYAPTFVPVLEHRYHDENLGTVNAMVESGELARRYSGLIFTSVRAAEAFARMVQARVDASVTSSGSQSLTFYTVGPATHRSICLVRDSHFPSARVVGEGSGTGEKLAHFIRRHVREEEDAVTTTAAAASRSDDQTDAAESATGGVDDGCPDRCRRLLFLVGETHRDDIPRILADPAQPEQERFQVDEMVVYETGVMDLFPDDFAQVVEQAKQRSNVIWVVVFSPTGCEQMLRILRKGPYEHAETEGSDDAADRQQNASKRCFIATIGPTTRDFLANRYGVVADVCADAPTPDAIQRGIDAFMEEHQIVC